MFNKSFWAHLAVTFAGVAITVFTPPVQGVLSSHPAAAAVVGGIWAAIGALINPKPAPAA